MSTQVIVPKPHPVPATETYREKAVRRFKENPWVPLGSLATVGALVVAIVKMRRGQSQSFNHWLRVRVAAQGLTIVAICAGTWSMRPKDSLAHSSSATTVDVDGERRRLEKMAKEKEEFEERLRSAEQSHQAEVGSRARGPKTLPESTSEAKNVVSGGWSAWLPWGSSSSQPTSTALSAVEETKPKS